MTQLRRPALPLLLLLVLLTAGCAPRVVAPSNPFTQVASPAATTAPREPLEQRLQQLKESVVLVTGSPDDVAQDAVARALRALASTLPVIADATKVRDGAKRLEQAEPTSFAHASVLKQTLTVAQEALLRADIPSDRRASYGASLATLLADIAAINEASALQDQRATVTEALCSAANTAFMAQGRPAPFQTSEPDARPRVPVGDYGAALEAARNAVLTLATTSWSDGRDEAAIAMLSLRAVMTSAWGEQHLEEVRELEFQAKRLSETGSTFGQAGWMKAGLQAALRALDKASCGRTTPASRAARRSVDSIVERSTLGLQRAMVQDALRATVDAFDPRPPARSTSCP